MTIRLWVWQQRRLRRHVVVFSAVVRRRRDRYGKGDSARGKGGSGNPDDRLEHLAPIP